MAETIKGISVSKGLAIGRVYFFEKDGFDIRVDKIREDEKTREINACKKIIDDYIEEISKSATSNQEEEAIIQAHIEMLSDDYFFSSIEKKIGEELKNIELSIHETSNEMAEIIEGLEDDYLKERALDYRDIGEKLIYRLKGIEAKNLSKLSRDCIVISKNLSPSDTLKMDKKRVLAFVTELGGKTSHTAIIAQSLSIPALIGIGNLSEKISDGDLVIVDGYREILIINPSDEDKKFYQKEIEKENKRRENLITLKGKKAISKDKREVKIASNVGSVEDLKVGIENGADGVGLFRTELLYMERKSLPSEEEQFIYYKKMLDLLKGKELIIRCLDIGADKKLPYLDLKKEDNPFLGYRAIRLLLDRPDIFESQLRAILRASSYGKIRIMVPYVSFLDEIIKVKNILEKIKKDLDKNSIAYDKNIEVGIMVETPSAVIMADDFIKEVDFFSIGTNDLTQYILAVDRGNERIAELYDPYNPSLLRAIKYVIDKSHKNGKWTGLCGSLASDPDATKLLLGLGLDEFSVVPSKIGEIKNIIINSSYEKEKALAEEILKSKNSDEVKNKLRDNKACF